MNENPCISCFWWECCACDGEGEVCKEYGSYNDLRKEYEKDIDAALEPVHEKWKNIFNNKRGSEVQNEQ